MDTAPMAQYSLLPKATASMRDVTRLRYWLPRFRITDKFSPSKPDNYRVSPNYLPSATASLTTPGPSVSEENSTHNISNILKDWSGRGSHVDFLPNESVPLTQGRFLGHGSMGGVYETVLEGHAFAWKQIFCRRKIGARERKEVEILRKVSHYHIVKLAGSYTQGQFLGFLLYPVAVCDLATLLEDIEAYHEEDIELSQRERLTTLGYGRVGQANMKHHDPTFLLSRIGCIARAIEYLHRQKIKHKDLKPSNILLSPDGLWLADFGTATDFSNQTVSTTDNWERGTPKYFAPEVAAYESNGRPIDIFALGCIFLEMCVITKYKSLEILRRLRSARDKSFHANLAQITSWIQGSDQWTSICDDYLRTVICHMLEETPKDRPTISQVCTLLSLMDITKRNKSAQRFFRDCCKEEPNSAEGHIQQLVEAKTRKKKAIDAVEGSHQPKFNYRENVLDQDSLHRDLIERDLLAQSLDDHIQSDIQATKAPKGQQNDATFTDTVGNEHSNTPQQYPPMSPYLATPRHRDSLEDPFEHDIILNIDIPSIAETPESILVLAPPPTPRLTNFPRSPF